MNNAASNTHRTLYQNQIGHYVLKLVIHGYKASYFI